MLIKQSIIADIKVIISQSRENAIRAVEPLTNINILAYRKSYF